MNEHIKLSPGILLFNSHTKINLSSANLIPPPSFTSPRPQPTTQSSKSFRELYLGAFSHLDVQTAITSPFYTISPLLRFNCFGWGRVITSIRDEDRRIHGVSDTTVGHAEEIKKSLSLVQRGGSLGWKGADVSLVKETKERLAEDFKHLMRETELLWETRDKMASNRRQKAERRWSALTNTFTYVYVAYLILDFSTRRDISKYLYSFAYQVCAHHHHQRHLRHERQRDQRQQQQPEHLAVFRGGRGSERGGHVSAGDFELGAYYYQAWQECGREGSIQVRRGGRWEVIFLDRSSSLWIQRSMVLTK